MKKEFVVPLSPLPSLQSLLSLPSLQSLQLLPSLMSLPRPSLQSLPS
jgi:hypothetical protein